jgi:hypothetical protein
MGNHSEPPARPQSLRDLLRQIKEEAEARNNHPIFRADQEKARRLAEALRIDDPPPEPLPSPQTAPPAEKVAGQKHGGGREPILTDEEEAQLGAAYWSNPPRRGKRTQAQAFEELRELLPEEKRGISDSALRNCVQRRRP